MENPQHQSDTRRERSRERSKEGNGYKDVAKQAVYKEGDVKESSGPAVSMTVVGERVEFTQHFHF
jgi:hypothetical protein